MKTLQEQYNQIKNGGGRKDLFLKEAKSTYPNLISNITSFKDAENILKNKSIINEELGGVVTLQPLVKLTSEDFNPNKQAWENKFEAFLAEEKAKSLKPVVNDKEKVNTKEQDEKIKAEAKKVDGTVENIEKRNYDYSPKVDNINNVNAQEMMNGVYYECKNDPSLSLAEAQEKVIKNLAKDQLHYVKEGQFGVGIGYTEQKVEENSGKTYGGSGYSDKLKDGKSDMVPVKESKLKELVKESLGGVVTSGNPNSLAAQSGDMFRQIMSEDEWQQQAGSQYHKGLYAEEEEKLPMDENEVEEAREKAIEASQEKAGMDEESRPDYPDVDGDGDTKEPMAKAAKDKKKKMKKESIDSKLAEIGKEAEKVKMEAQLDFLHDHIQEKVDRVSSIQEDENLSELIDKSKMKQMQREIKDLERKKMKMEKIYEKSCGAKYAKKEMVDETEIDNE
jgi:hypothetical protein